jgi:hypothetical protein
MNAPGRYCLAVCYCGQCAHYKPMLRVNPVPVLPKADKRQAETWAEREEATWIDKD